MFALVYLTFILHVRVFPLHYWVIIMQIIQPWTIRLVKTSYSLEPGCGIWLEHFERLIIFGR